MINKINRGKNSYWINEEIVDTVIETTVNLLHHFTLGKPNISPSSSTHYETKFLNFKLKWEKLVSKSYENYNTHLKNLEEQIQNKDKMIENLLHTADSRLFEPALVRTSCLFEPFFIPRGYSLTSSTILQLFEPSVVRTFVYSNRFLNPRDQ